MARMVVLFRNSQAGLFLPGGTVRVAWGLPGWKPSGVGPPQVGSSGASPGAWRLSLLCLQSSLLVTILVTPAATFRLQTF